MRPQLKNISIIASLVCIVCGSMFLSSANIAAARVCIGIGMPFSVLAVFMSDSIKTNKGKVLYIALMLFIAAGFVLFYQLIKPQL